VGIRKSSGKNKKSKAATVRNSVKRDEVRRQDERARGKGERRLGAR
jgi:hypothetical protein